ncbi:MAG TPA: PIN domain-containing protein [Lichenihabitans sp.]|jgi:predicted nucleic acid-binding protein|nr:PIN domain-containing protein [Lichenihabitans sp.]
MRSERFLDTNILIYAALGRQDDRPKYEIAKQIIANERFGLSGQVLAEFYVGVTRRPETTLTPPETDRWMDLLGRFPTVSIDEMLVRTAIIHARRFQIHYYDAAIIAAAERLEASILYTEDLNHGQRYGSVLVQNPFRDP